MGNVLERVTIEKHPIIEEIKTVMKDCGAMNAMMSGSGPTVFGIFQDQKTARFAKQEMIKKRIAKDVYVANVHNTRRM